MASMTARVESAWFADEDPEDPHSQANYYGWNLKVLSGSTTYTARRYQHEDDVTFYGFERPGELAPHWRGPIPYGDREFRDAVRAVLKLDGVQSVRVFTSNETGLPEPVDLALIDEP